MLNYNPNNTNWKNIENGLQKYLQIMQLVKNSNVEISKEFQRKFNGFYKVRRKKDFRNALYEYLEKNKNKHISFEQTLNFFYQKFDRLEPSFSSKIVATIDPNYPVWDSEVLARLKTRLKIRISANTDKKVRFEKIVKTYTDIANWYFEFLKTKQAKEMIKDFDKRIGISDITDTKKIDLIIWQTRS